MKKIIALLMAVLMLASCGVMAFAAEIDNTTANSSTVVVKTSADASAEWYEVDIPATTTVPWGTETAVSVSYTVACQLADSKTLSVAITSANGNKFTSATLTGEIAYTPAGFGAQVFQAVTGAKGAGVAPATAATITVPEANWNGIAIGEYQDTLTYTVTVA